jgi:hypothetical protein
VLLLNEMIRQRVRPAELCPFTLIGTGEKSCADTAIVEEGKGTAEQRHSFTGLSFTGLSFAGLSFTGLSFTGLSSMGLSFKGARLNKGTALRGTASQQRGGKQTLPKTSERQVHPTASSGLPRQPNINAIRLSIHPKVPLLSHFDKEQPQLRPPRFSVRCSIGPQCPD